MPAPGTAQDFLNVVEKSGLLDAHDLDRYRFLSAADPSPPDRVAHWMVTEGRLTPFQSTLLLAGKSRPFFIGPYTVLSRLGNGSMGVVYLCEHRGLRRKVALKVLQNRRVRDEVALERFLREARAAAALDHPNVVKALDFGCENHLHFLAMEYIDGHSLKELIRSEGPLPPLQAADYLRQAALGVQHAHEAGLIHRDIKPSNLMINRSGIVKLLDLGLARLTDDDVVLTRGAPLGTMAYMAPEQAVDSHAVDERADIYSLGATFYLAMTNRPPVAGAGIGEDLHTHDDDPENFERLITVLRKMTALVPDRRYRSAAEIAEELEAWTSPRPLIACRVPSAEPAGDEWLEEPTSSAACETVSDTDAVASLYATVSDEEIHIEPPAVFEVSPLPITAAVEEPIDGQSLARPPRTFSSLGKYLLLGLAGIVGVIAAIASRG